MKEYTFKIPAEIVIETKADDAEQAVAYIRRTIRDNAQISGKIFITLPIGWNNIDIIIPIVDETVIDKVEELNEKPF